MSSSVSMKDEPTFESPSPVIAVGQVAPDFELTLLTGFTIKMSELTSRTPVLLNFIKGVWCPFCQQHLRNLRKWRSSLEQKNVTILVISNESLDILRAWTHEHPVEYQMGTVKDKNVFSQYGVDIKSHDFPRPATFLLEKGMQCILSHYGLRDETLESKIK